MTATVTIYQDPRSKINRAGEQEWSVTTYDGQFSETQKFWEYADAQKALGEAIEVGFVPIGKEEAHG